MMPTITANVDITPTIFSISMESSSIFFRSFGVVVGGGVIVLDEGFIELDVGAGFSELVVTGPSELEVSGFSELVVSELS